MSLADLTSSTAVLDAIREFDEIGQEGFLQKYGFGRSRDYVVLHDGKPYDAKALVGAAHAYQHPDLGPLSGADFNGGKPTTDKLQSLGFTVETISDREPSDHLTTADELASFQSRFGASRSRVGYTTRPPPRVGDADGRSRLYTGADRFASRARRRWRACYENVRPPRDDRRTPFH
jgi:hypothetical protein